MVNFSRSVLKIYTGQKKFTRAAPVAPVTNIRYVPVFKEWKWSDVITRVGRHALKPPFSAKCRR